MIRPEIQLHRIVADCVRAAKVERAKGGRLFAVKRVPLLAGIDANVPDEIAREVLRRMAKNGLRIVWEGGHETESAGDAGDVDDHGVHTEKEAVSAVVSRRTRPAAAAALEASGNRDAPVSGAGNDDAP